MTDHFALFGEPRQPWLDLDALKEKYHQFTREAHPDIAPNAARTGFENINAAYHALSDPKQRLQHLLELEGSETRSAEVALTDEMQQFFLRIGELTQKARTLPERMQNATGALSRSLARKEAAQLAEEIGETLRRVSSLHENSLRELEQLNAVWKTDKTRVLEELKMLYATISFLMRWIEQLKEMQLHLTP